VAKSMTEKILNGITELIRMLHQT